MDPRVIEVTGILDDKYQEQIAPSELARGVGLSRRQLERLFVEGTGLSIRKYLRRKRLTEAADLLLRTHLRISELAYRVGFGDPDYFSRLFKRRFAKTPTQFRNDPRKEMSVLSRK